jgi:hypothetical protein
MAFLIFTANFIIKSIFSVICNANAAEAQQQVPIKKFYQYARAFIGVRHHRSPYSEVQNPDGFSTHQNSKVLKTLPRFT